MKNIFCDTVDWLKSTKISKQCDSSLSFSCGKSESPLTIAMKGNYSVDGIQLLAVVGVMSVACIALAVAKKIKN